MTNEDTVYSEGGVELAVDNTQGPTPNLTAARFELVLADGDVRGFDTYLEAILVQTDVGGALREVHE
jgi:hypothetical protein